MRLPTPLRYLRPSFTLGLLAVTALALSQTESPSVEEDAMSSFGKMIPQGFVNKNVVVPSFKDGKRSSLLTAETLTRLDDERLTAEKVVVEIYAEDPAENLRVDLISAVYDMQEKVLRSGERSRVSRADFEMEGDSMVFNTVNSIGSMKGRVRTLIFDMDSVSGKSEGEQNAN
jgi:hypothetical protein